METIAAPYVLRAGEERSHPGTFPTIKADAADTGGAMTAMEGVLAPWASGPPLHVHSREDECLYVIDGSVLVQIGDAMHTLEAGSFAWMPRGVPHAFANAGSTPARMFGVTLPGGIEEMFAAQSDYLASVDGAPDLAELARLCAAWGLVLGPPIRAASAPVLP
jgi:mannose-6-phosphate isomerase-like protein (cupin superfamily)